jgi:hypothetical protein
MELSDYYFDKGCDLGHKRSCSKSKVIKIKVKQKFFAPVNKMNSVSEFKSHIEDSQTKIIKMFKYHCDNGSNAACESLRCQTTDKGSQKCKDLTKRGFQRMGDFMKDPMAYLEKNRDSLTPGQYEEYKGSFTTLDKMVKNCSAKKKKCIIDGVEYDKMKEFLNVSEDINRVTISIAKNKCSEGNQDACFEEALGRVTQEAAASLRSISKDLQR